MKQSIFLKAVAEYPCAYRVETSPGMICKFCANISLHKLGSTSVLVTLGLTCREKLIEHATPTNDDTVGARNPKQPPGMYKTL